MNNNICILDYGSGNVRSVYNMVSLLFPQVTISNEPAAIQAATHLILPGVGAFKASMEKINKKIPVKVLENEVFKIKKPFLGICVGMQVLADTGHEFEDYPGLGWIKGDVRKIDTGNLPLPHVGWNNTTIVRENRLVNNVTNNFDFYFVHSYAFFPRDPKTIIATTKYGQEFCTIVSKDNIFGVQFHPEKSQQAGKVVLENFLSI